MIHLRLEDDGFGGKFVHCEVAYWTASAKRELIKMWEELKAENHGSPLFALHDPDEHDDPEKHLKFLKLFGFEEVMDVILVDGREATLFTDLNGYKYD